MQDNPGRHKIAALEKRTGGIWLGSILGRLILGAESIASAIRDQLKERLGQEWEVFSSPWDIVREARRIIDELSPLITQHLSDADVIGWVSGMTHLAGQLPPNVLREFQAGVRSDPGGGGIKPPMPRLLPMFEGEPRLRFPMIEQAAQRLVERQIMTREEWDRANQLAQERAFFVTADITKRTIGDIRQAVVDELNQGASLKGFQNRIANIVDAGSLGTAHLETIYRTNIQAAFRDGRETLANHPAVDRAFPYQQYVNVHDDRTRPEHKALETLGLNGTAVYRRDDPFWDYFTPPWDYNCRCGVILLTIRQAAEMGVKEAQEWLRTGKPPTEPEYRLSAIPFEPQQGFGQRGRQPALV
jgi:SPP1 gp7 family putative phage head morphogenesis protein